MAEVCHTETSPLICKANQWTNDKNLRHKRVDRGIIKPENINNAVLINVLIHKIHRSAFGARRARTYDYFH